MSHRQAIWCILKYQRLILNYTMQHAVFNHLNNITLRLNTSMTLINFIYAILTLLTRKETPNQVAPIASIDLGEAIPGYANILNFNSRHRFAAIYSIHRLKHAITLQSRTIKATKHIHAQVHLPLHFNSNS